MALFSFSFLVTGRLNGVAKQLQDDFPWLMPVACAAHRLALACKDASSEVPYMSTFRDHLKQLHQYFQNSANRTAVLKAASQSLGLEHLKVKVRGEYFPLLTKILVIIVYSRCIVCYY